MIDRTAIVTGAGSGIGQATAVMLGAEGYAVALVGRTASKLEDTARRISGQTLVLAADVMDAGECQEVIDRTLAAWGHIDALAHVAGHAPSLPIEKVTPELWKQCIETNLGAAVYLTAALWPALREQKSGVIVNVSSLASISPFPGFGIYAAAKAGLNMFTLVTATEAKKVGATAVTVAPGAVETAMLRSIFNEKTIPKDRTLDPRDVARVIVDCITGKRTFTPGEVIQVPSP